MSLRRHTPAPYPSAYLRLPDTTFLCPDTSVVTSLGWTPTNNECFTVSDDKTVLRWSMDGDTADKVADIDSFVTDLKWYSQH